ncbi:MAG TPA: hypothetical protein VFM02_00365 [Candidatus Paceibacterota bacterium]|nr:hypothetical protein [Candidatus Paceibacterota bacterium]
MKYEQNRVVYYWASWKRVGMVAIPMGLFILVPLCASGSLHSLSTIVLGGVSSATLMLVMAAILSSFVRIKGTHVLNVNFGEWHSMNATEIESIFIVSRYAFTDKATLVEVKKKNPGIFPGFLLSRDAFPDEKIAAIVNHLLRLNPAIELDERVREIVQKYT